MSDDGASPRGPLSTGDLARRAGTTLRTVRFYEQAGVLRPSGHGPGGRRHYTFADLERLALILDLRELDLSIDEIRGLLEVRAGCADAGELAERFGLLLQEQIERAQRRLSALRRLKAELSTAAELLEDCRTCQVPLEHHACASCDTAAGGEAPRIMKVIVGRPAARTPDRGDP